MKEFKEYPIITNKECEDKKMYMIIDILDIFYKNYIRNSKESVNIVLHFFEEYSKKNNINCGNLYVVPFEYKGNFEGYYGACDGLSFNYIEIEEGHSFLDYCYNIGLDLDYYIEDNN